jgi:hypothetical protein
MAESGSPIVVPFKAFLQNVTGTLNCRCIEQLLSLIGPRAGSEAHGLHWGGTENATPRVDAGGNAVVCGDVNLMPLDIRTFQVSCDHT